MHGSAVVAAAVLVLAARAAAQPPQQVVLPGPVPYPTVSPPLTAYSPTPVSPTHYVFHIASDQRVRVGVDEEGQPAAVRVLERLVVSGKGDYQFGIPGPISDVQAAPGTDSQPGLRVNQLLWVGFSQGHKVLAADVTIRARQAAPYLPVRLDLTRESGGATLSVTNATGTPVLEYAGVVRSPEMARLLDETRRVALAGVRVAPAHATFYGLVRERMPRPVIEAPVHVEGELRLPGGNPVRFSRTLGDGGPLSLRVHAAGTGRPQVALRAVPVPVDRLLRPPGAATWRAAVARRPIPAALLLRRLLDTRNMLVRADQYHTFLQNPDADGRNRIVYEYASATPAPRAAAPAPKPGSGSGGSGVLVVLLAVGASLLGAGAAIVAWAHS